ncbi:MAG: FAD-dependent oxidoreductase [Ilumatobacteraceae bacterium]
MPRSGPGGAPAGAVLAHADVTVVGGGPAGAAAAIELRRAGRSVTVVDKAAFPRDKCCGDGLTTLALRELEQLGFTPQQVDDWFDVDAAWLRSPSGREVRVPLPRSGAYAAITPRLQLDGAVLDLARAAGATVLERHAARGVEHHAARHRPDQSVEHGRTEPGHVDPGHVDPGHVEPGHVEPGHVEPGHVEVVVAPPDGTLGRVRSRYVVAADGMWSPVRRALGLGAGHLGEWHAFRQYASGVTGTARERLHVWFEPDLLPGYAWSFPLPGDRANIGFGVLRDGTRRIADMKHLWSDLLTRPHVVAALGEGAALVDRHTAWPIPARIDTALLAHERVMFVGDAAAATDVMTGEGIGQALLTGRLAAEAIVAAGATRPGAARDRYERAVRHHLVADHHMSRLLGRALTSERGARGAIRVVGASGEWGRRNFARWMFEDEPRAVLLTPSRWHRRFLARPGAWAA